MITYAEYQKMFQKDKTGSYISLVIPETKEQPALDLSGKLPREYSVDEVIRLKKYVGEMFKLVDKATITD